VICCSCQLVTQQNACLATTISTHLQVSITPVQLSHSEVMTLWGQHNVSLCCCQMLLCKVSACASRCVLRIEGLHHSYIAIAPQTHAFAISNYLPLHLFNSAPTLRLLAPPSSKYARCCIHYNTRLWACVLSLDPLGKLIASFAGSTSRSAGNSMTML
jgi:hypothetical protein